MAQKKKHSKPKAHGKLTKKPKKSVKKTSGMSTYYKNWNPLEPLRGKSAQREVGAATRLEFDPQKRELNRAMAGSDARQGQIDKWYGEYQQHLAQLNGQTAGAYGQANEQIGAFSQQQGQMDAANRANIEASGRADAALRGQEYSPQGALDATNAANARQQLLQAQQARVSGQGANQAAYGNATLAAAQHQGVEQHTAEAENRKMLDSDARELAAKEGDFRTDFLRQLREDERKYNIESAAAKVDKYKSRTDRKKAKETGRHNRVSESETARGHTLTRKSSREGHATTRRGQDVSAQTQDQSRHAQNVRDRKNRRQDAYQHAHPQKDKGGKGKGKKGKI